MSMLPDIVIVFRLNGERKELAYRKLPFSVWSELKAQLCFTPASLPEALSVYDVEALGAVIWLERKQWDRTLRWPTVRSELEREEVDIEFIDVIVDGQSGSGNLEPDDAPVEEEPDPTRASS